VCVYLFVKFGIWVVYL